MGDNLILNLDLNREPSDDESPTSPLAIQSTVNGIEDRIRVLNGLYGSVSQPQRHQRVINDPPLYNHIWNISQLAKALEVENANKKINNNNNIDNDDGNNGNCFDCSICFDLARDPVLTCCGHLFCWSCFYQVPYVGSISKECPVCEGEVVDSNVIPIYGNGNENKNGKSLQDLKLDNNVKTPPRPPAHRVESDRQQGFETRFDIGTYVRNEPQPDYQVRIASFINASASIQPVPQRNIVPTLVNLGTMPLNGAIEIDETISHSRRRRGYSAASNSEGEPSLEVSRRRLR